MFPTNSECLIGIFYTFFAFCLRVSVILPTSSLYPQQKRAYSVLHPQLHARRHLLSAVLWISEYRLLWTQRGEVTDQGLICGHMDLFNVKFLKGISLMCKVFRGYHLPTTVLVVNTSHTWLSSSQRVHYSLVQLDPELPPFICSFFLSLSVCR